MGKKNGQHKINSMLPDSLPPAFWDLKPVWKLLQKEGLLWALSWFDTHQIATITQAPTHIWWDMWKWVKLPFTGHHPRWIDNESVLHLSEWYGPVMVISIGLAVLDAVARNLPEQANEKYDLFQRLWSLHTMSGGEWAWKFHFPNTKNWGDGFILSHNRESINPYDQ